MSARSPTGCCANTNKYFKYFNIQILQYYTYYNIQYNICIEKKVRRSPCQFVCFIKEKKVRRSRCQLGAQLAAVPTAHRWQRRWERLSKSRRKVHRYMYTCVFWAVLWMITLWKQRVSIYILCWLVNMFVSLWHRPKCKLYNFPTISILSPSNCVSFFQLVSWHSVHFFQWSSLPKYKEKDSDTESSHQTEISLQIWQGDRDCLSLERMYGESFIKPASVMRKILLPFF